MKKKSDYFEANHADVKMCLSADIEAEKMCLSGETDTYKSRLFTMPDEYIEIFDFPEGYEEKHTETMVQKAGNGILR